MMDDIDLQPPPRKKIKPAYPSMDGTMDEPVPPGTGPAEPVGDVTGTQQDLSNEQRHKEVAYKVTEIQQDLGNEQRHKEVECGIVEFVSPELTGFKGISKKRYYTLAEVG